MKILGISGSPRKNGNTAYAVSYALELLHAKGADVRYLTLAGKDIRPCLGCWRCREDRGCKIHDDDMNAVLDELRWCDGLILGSPVYFGMVPGNLKSMMDRTVVFRLDYENHDKELAGKIGCGIACGGFRQGGQEITLQNIQTYLLQQSMLVMNDGPHFSHSGGTIVGEAKDDTLGLETIRHMTDFLFANLAKREIGA